MSEPASISSGIAERYATAVFELFRESGTLDKLETNISDLADALGASPELRNLIDTPVISRAEQGKAIMAVGAHMKLEPSLQSALGLMAEKRRLFVLPQVIERLREMIARDKGEVTVEVASAKALTKSQSAALSKTLQSRLGQKVKINATVDEALIGGLVVKVGSKMIDTTILARLNSLQNAMKEVG